MKLNISWAILFFVLFSFSSFSQDSPTKYLGLKNHTVSNNDTSKLFFFCRKSNDNAFSKSQKIWKKSILLTTTNDTFAVEARLHLKEDLIEILIANNPCLLFQEKVKAIVIGDTVYMQSEYPNKDQLYRGYFKIISEGNVTFLKKGNEYYLKKKDLPAQYIKPNKRTLCKIAKGQQNDIENYMRKKKLNPKKEKDLIQLFYFINEDDKLAQKLNKSN